MDTALARAGTSVHQVVGQRGECTQTFWIIELAQPRHIAAGHSSSLRPTTLLHVLELIDIRIGQLCPMASDGEHHPHQLMQMKTLLVARPLRKKFQRESGPCGSNHRREVGKFLRAHALKY